MSEYIKRYFTEIWKPNPDSEHRNKENEEVRAGIKDTDLVLDVGCGYHPHKGKIKNLYGIDKYNEAADLVIDMLSFDAPPNHYDVIIAQGSTNLFSKEIINRQIDRIVYWLKPGGKIYMRVNPGLEMITSPQEDLYKWTIEDIAYYTNKYNLSIIDPVVLRPNLRYTFTWQKNK
jgi:cyclopropane fatty-acyl-phospholipid synthase-like methyltransferase